MGDMSDNFTRRWMAHGIECGIAPSSRWGHLNGYVRLPEGWKGNIHDLDTQLSKHVSAPDPGGWIGFDTNHLWDYWPREERMSRVSEEHKEWFEKYYYEELHDPSGSIWWTEEKVVEETERLAKQVLDDHISHKETIQNMGTLVFGANIKTLWSEQR